MDVEDVGEESIVLMILAFDIDVGKLSRLA